MYTTLDRLIYHSESHFHHYYYTSLIDEMGSRLHQLLGKKEAIHFFPEATLKSNSFPNGIAIHSPYNNTTLIPALLRDPGCGYLIFKIKTTHHNDEVSLKDALSQFCDLLESNQINMIDPSIGAAPFLKSILYEGTKNINHVDLNKFVYPYFSIEQDIHFTTEDYLDLYNELNNVTNTIEIKKIIHFELTARLQQNDFATGDLLGFIHTGTDVFPQIISRLFFKKMADYSYINGLTTVDEIRRGLYAIPLSDELAYTYFQYVKAAMNYCVAKRWLIFNSFANFSKRLFNLEVELINDRAHAGAFEKKLSRKNVIIQSRGVQDFYFSKENPSQNFYWLAGQRETISFLITPSSLISKEVAIGHGTSYAIHDGYNYEELLGEQNTQNYINICDQLVANTPIIKSSCLGYTFNILSQLQYLVNQQYCSAIYCLMPLVNYQSKSLIKRSSATKE